MRAPVEKSFERWLEDSRSLIEERMGFLLPSDGHPPVSLHRSMRYASLGGGKRLRGILCMEAHRIAGDPYPEAALDAACAVELLHAYTLVHDDLPVLDDDLMRRGKPSCHAEFGEATALLAGDALQALAFEVLSRCEGPPNENVLQSVGMLAEAAGSRFLVGGQVADIEAEGDDPDGERVLFIHLRKTAELIAVSLGIGATLAEGSSERTGVLVEAGRKIGLAFQITDDILDITGKEGEVGKQLRKDVEKGKMTWPACHGLESSRKKVDGLVDEAISAVRIAGNSQYLENMFKLVAGRSS